MLPSNQTRLATVGSIMLSQKTIPGNFAAKILKTRRAKRKNKTKARGELFASDSQVVFAILITAKLTHFDEPVARESHDEFRACTIEN